MADTDVSASPVSFNAYLSQFKVFVMCAALPLDKKITLYFSAFVRKKLYLAFGLCDLLLDFPPSFS